MARRGPHGNFCAPFDRDGMPEIDATSFLAPLPTITTLLVARNRDQLWLVALHVLVACTIIVLAAAPLMVAAGQLRPTPIRRCIRQ